MLNGAKQLKRGGNIRFIYAIKDSIFDELGARAALDKVDSEVSAATDAAYFGLARANRTKFFDLVIPVVPFVTHRSARDLLTRVMGQIDHKVSKELIDIAGRHITDMRLIKNVRNEFVIFREKIVFDNESVPGLSEDQLFAMMLYKSLHLSDFEAIKSGQSKLDELYNAGRTLVSQNIDRLDLEEQSDTQRASKVLESAERSAKLGLALKEHLERVFRTVGATIESLTLGGQTLADEEIQTSEFWVKYLSAEEELTATVQAIGRQSQSFVLSRTDLAAALDDSLSPRDWQEGDRVSALRRLEGINNDRELLKHADMSDLMGVQKFMLAPNVGKAKSFRQLAGEYLGSDLARQLVDAGYIDRNFTLYTSTFYAERVSSQAANFIIHNVGPNVTDVHFALTPADVEAVLQEQGASVLRERGIYNIHVLDHLLEANDARADVLLQKLSTFGQDEESFLQSYLASGQLQEPLVRKLVERWRLAFLFVVVQAKVDDFTRLKLLNAALESIVDGKQYSSNEAVRKYFEEHYSELAVFTSDTTSREAASRIAALLASMSARLPLLALLGADVKKVVIAENLYSVTLDNLVVAIGDVQDLGLDAIRKRDRGVYDHVLGHLAEYLVALREIRPEPPTIADVDDFKAIIEEVLEHSASLLPEVVASASPECEVSNLVEVSEAAWPVLAQHRRFPATFHNVTAYITSVAGFDASLSHLLALSGSITVPTTIDESLRQSLASGLLAASDALPDPATRVQLVVSLGLSDPLPAASITAEPGELIGLLIAREVILDDEASFALTRDTDWTTREFAIHKSKKFESFMTPTELPAQDVAALLASRLASKAVKESLMARISEFTIGADQTTLTAISKYALQTGRILAIGEVARFAEAKIPAHLVVRLIQPLLAGLSLAELSPILHAVGGEYADVTQRNGKRPTLPNTTADLALVSRLEQLGVVSTHNLSGNKIKVNVKHPA